MCTHAAGRVMIASVVFVVLCGGQTWTNLGPSTLGGRVKSVAIDPSDAGRWLLGSASGGVWESRDSGETWTPITEYEASQSIGSIAFSPSNARVVYAGTGEGTWAFQARAGEGVLRSTDGGATWLQRGASTFLRTAVSAIRVDPRNPDGLVAVMTRGVSGRMGETATGPASLGLQRSYDGGVTWTQKLAGESTSLETDPTNFDRQYAGMALPAGWGFFNVPVPSGLYRSLDGGQSWAMVNGPWSQSNIGRLSIAVAPSDTDTVYVSVQGGTDINGRLLGLYRSDNAWDAQPSWIQIPTNRSWTTAGCPNCQDYCLPRCFELPVMSVDPTEPNTLFVGGISLWRCEHCDGAPDWKNIGVGAEGQASLPQNQRCLVWNQDRLLVCTDGGLFSTTDGGASWRDHNRGLAVTRFQAGDLHPTDANSALGGMADGAVAIWMGDIWEAKSSGQTETAFSSAHPDTQWMAATRTRIFRTTDGGRTFSPADSGVDASGAAAVMPVKKCPAHDDVFLAGSTRLFRSGNFFQSGTPMWSVNSETGASITAIAFAPSEASCETYAYGTTAGEIRITTDGGKSWSDADPQNALPACGSGPAYCARAISSLAFDAVAPGTLYAAFSGFNNNAAKPGHLFRTLDWKGAAPVWVDVSPPVDLPVNVVALDPGNEKSVFAGTDSGVWHSSDGGEGWRLLGPAAGMPNVAVFDLKINPATNRIVAFTFGRGAYSLDLGSVPVSGHVLSLFRTPVGLAANLGVPFAQTFDVGGRPPYNWRLVSGTLPPGLVLTPGGELMGTPLNPGTFTFTLVVRDGLAGMASRTFRITVGTTGTAAVWSGMGPAPIGLNSFGQAGRIASIAIDPSDGMHWLVGYGNSGLWESRDGGGSFRPIADSAPTLVMGAVAFAPSNPNVIYAGTGEATGPGFTKAGVGMLKSTDGGRTWAVMAAPTFARASVRTVRVHPTNPELVLATVTRGGFGRDSIEGVPGAPPMGVVRSTNGGLSWERTLPGFATGLVVDPTDFNKQYAAIGEVRTPNGVNNDGVGNSQNGLYRSTDGGRTWGMIPGPWGVSTASRAAVGRIELAIAPSNPGVIYASMAVAPNGGSNALPLRGLYRTDNAWSANPAWIEISTAGTGEGGYCGPTKCNYSHVLSVDPSNADILFAGGGGYGLWKCASCRATPVWTEMTTRKGLHPDYHSLVWAGERLIAGNDGGVWSTWDRGESWQNHNVRLPTLMFFGGDLHPTHPDIILGGFRDHVTALRRATGEWVTTGGTPIGVAEIGEAEVAISTSRPETHWMGAWIWGVVGRTTDGGRTWYSADAGVDKSGSIFVAPVRKCPANDDVFLTGTNRIFRIDNFFSAATPVWATNSPAGRGRQETVLSIAYAPTDRNCNTYGYGMLGGQVRLTRDGGKTWTDLDPGSTLPARGVNSLAFDPVNPAVIYAAISSFDEATPGKRGHVFKTTNGMAQLPVWVQVGPSQNEPFNVVAVDPLNPRLVYAGGDAGLWRSTDGAGTWIRQGPELGMPDAAPVYDIKINPNTGRTVVFTYGRSAFALGPELMSVKPSTDGLTYVAEGGQLAGGPDDAVVVRVNGEDARVNSTGPQRIIFQIPRGITGTAAIQVWRDGIPSNKLSVVLSQPSAAVKRLPLHAFRR